MSTFETGWWTVEAVMRVPEPAKSARPPITSRAKLCVMNPPWLRTEEWEILAGGSVKCQEWFTIAVNWVYDRRTE
jgi:hypothetical protein